MLKFEEELERVGELDDPLSVFDQYYSHLLSTHADAVTLTRILERATQMFVDDRRYRNDPRYLRLWLAYALRCREPEDIYAFLAMRSIASELASYYEEYAAYLERKGEVSKAAAVLRAGVERNAQPQERLHKRWMDFCTRHPQKKEERPAYRRDALVDVQGRGELSFEEVRAKSWRRAGSILKASYVPPAPATTEDAEDDVLDDFDAALGPIDPDELTHVSVYKDNTADLRELARSLPPPENKKKSEGDNYDVRLFDQFLASAPAKPTLELRTSRLSLIPEESDANTQATGLITSLLARPNHRPAPPLSIGPAELLQMRAAGTVPSIESVDPLRPRLATLEKSIGRDGVGNNHTVASLRVAAGHYFVERRLASSVLLGIDLEADIAGSDLHQVILKVHPDSLWEASVLARLAGLPGIPTLAKVCRHPDASLFTESFYPHGSIATLLTRCTVDEKLFLFWTRELLLTMTRLLQRGIVHGRLALEHVLVRLGPNPLLVTFDPTGGGGWSDRGIVLVGFSKAIDLQTLPETALLDDVAFADYAPYCEGTHRRILTLDVAGLLRLLSILLDNRVLRYNATWDEVRLALQALVLHECSVVQLVAGLERIQQTVDAVLLHEALTLPTLKSLLTRLEISLLERNPS